MRQQVLAIHGGTSFNTYEEYIQFLKTREVTLEKLRGAEDWKGSLARELGETFEVFCPKMPNGANARYLEWSIWFERCASALTGPTILIGHSLGGIFLAKYLSEHQFSQPIVATVLVGAPFEDTSTVESLTDFALPASLEAWSAQSEKIYLVHSSDDPVVPVGEAAKYQAQLPKAEEMILADRGHFNQPDFPELVALLRRLAYRW